MRDERQIVLVEAAGPRVPIDRIGGALGPALSGVFEIGGAAHGSSQSESSRTGGARAPSGFRSWSSGQCARAPFDARFVLFLPVFFFAEARFAGAFFGLRSSSGVVFIAPESTSS